MAKKYLVIILIIAVILIAIFSHTTNKNPHEKYEKFVAKGYNYSYCEKIKEGERDLCYYTFGRVNNDASACEKIKDINTKDNCYFVVGKEKKDAFACEKIENKIQDKIYCLAVATEDPKYCGQIEYENLQDICYETLAFAKGDPSLCAKMRDKETFEMIPSNQRDSCYFWLVKKYEGAISICNNIKYKTLKEECIRYAAWRDSE